MVRKQRVVHDVWLPDPRVANTLALFGSLFGVLSWLAPIDSFWMGGQSVYKLRSTRPVATITPYIATLFNCFLWNCYAYDRLDTMGIPFVVNCLGLVLNASFIVCYLKFASVSQWEDAKFAFSVLSAFTVPVYLAWQQGLWIDLLGNAAAFVNIVMIVSPLTVIPRMVKTRDASGFNVPSILLNLASSAVWLAFGLYVWELPNIATNIIGTLAPLVQLYVIWSASRGKARPTKIDKAT